MRNSLEKPAKSGIKTAGVKTRKIRCGRGRAPESAQRKARCQRQGRETTQGELDLSLLGYIFRRKKRQEEWAKTRGPRRSRGGDKGQRIKHESPLCRTSHLRRGSRTKEKENENPQDDRLHNQEDSSYSNLKRGACFSPVKEAGNREGARRRAESGQRNWIPKGNPRHQHLFLICRGEPESFTSEGKKELLGRQRRGHEERVSMKGTFARGSGAKHVKKIRMNGLDRTKLL